MRLLCTEAPSKQTGQAMTEFVVICVILVPLFVLLPLLGKYIDVNHATIKASRYVAWERAVGRGNATEASPIGEIARETRRRYFSRENLTIKTNDGSDDNTSGDKNPLWVDARNRPLLGSFSDVKIALTEGDKPSDGLAGSLNLIKSNFKLVPTGIYTAIVQADIGRGEAQNAGFANLSRVIPLTFNARTAIIGDVWAAKNSGEVEGNVKGSTALFENGIIPKSNVPQLAIVNTLTRTALQPAVIFERNVTKFEVQRVKSEIVPEDRLGPYQGAGQ